MVYQGCDPAFEKTVGEKQRREVRAAYGLPERYILSVGTIEERKNLMLTVRAMVAGKLDIDLVACGRHTRYADRVMEYAAAHGIGSRVRMLHSVPFSDLPALYQMASVFVYPSFYEGFGIPILEALNSRVPVITTRGGVFRKRVAMPASTWSRRVRTRCSMRWRPCSATGRRPTGCARAVQPMPAISANRSLHPT